MGEELEHGRRLLPLLDSSPGRGSWLTTALADRANLPGLRLTVESRGPSEVATSETHPQTAVAPEVVALMEGVLLRALVNNGPMALALEIFLRLDGPAQFRQSFESRGVLGQELVPCLLGPLQAGHVGFQSLVVRTPKRRSYGSPTACHASRAWSKRSPVSRTSRRALRLPHRPSDLSCDRLRCSLVVESGAAKRLGRRGPPVCRPNGQCPGASLGGLVPLATNGAWRRPVRPSGQAG